ncbi:MAG: metallophosphoesterase [Planctomycetota bacterium]|nr:metallophosphoesterase [Planctomycetota bacterium]
MPSQHHIRNRVLRRQSMIFSLFLVVATAVTSSAHDDHDSKGSSTGQPAVGTALVLPAIEGPKPWSEKPVLSDPNRFSIAIMTDRTGGHRPGIWMKAVDRVNWMRPDFVVSVGDLIEGYTNDDAEIERQWKEFTGFIDQMKMKFFFVAGNHDVTNPKLHQVWRDKFGPEWYSFDYKGVHFVCLSSEDPSAHIGDKQLDWLKKDLAASVDARWTLVFLHKPLWTYAEREVSAGNEDPTNWKQVETQLVDRPHTVFAGHVHHYVQYQRNGQQYYSLATTGGGSRLRGVEYGEFDHITWLTMEKDGPHVANLLLDGIQPAGVVTEESIAEYRNFLAKVRIEVKPILVSGDALRSGEIQVTVTNDYGSDVSIDATISGLPLVGLDMESQTIELTAKARQTVEKIIPFSMREEVDFARFRMTTLTAKVRSLGDKPLKAERTAPVIVDHEYRIDASEVILDGKLDEWADADWWSTDETPTLTGEVKNWNGQADGSFQLATRYDEENIYFAAKIRDEKVLAGDSLSVAIDPRPLLARLARNRLGGEAISVRVGAPKDAIVAGLVIQPIGRVAKEAFKAMGSQTNGGYELEFSVPIQNVLTAQGKDWNNMQVGARLRDVDESSEPPVEILWRASPRPLENRSFGHVIRH